jgi:hypothetical protein
MVVQFDPQTLKKEIMAIWAYERENHECPLPIDHDGG